MEKDTLRQRSRSKLIRVTFPGGKHICYSNATETFIGALCEIGSDKFARITLQSNHLPIISQEIYPRLKNYMKLVCDGWYVNIQSSTDQKYMQLRSISDSLGLDLKVEIGDDFEILKNPNKVRRTKTKDRLRVTFPDGECFGGDNSAETFVACLRKIGVDDIKRKNLEWGGNPLITTHQISNRQLEIGFARWATIPNSNKDRIKLLKVLAIHFKLALDISMA